MSADKRTQSRPLRPNLVLTSKREAKGWTSRRRAARELHALWRTNLPGLPDLESLEKALYRHETGRTQVRDEAYRRLYCLAYEASPHELFGSMENETGTAGTFVVRSHKIIPAFIGAEAAALLVDKRAMRPGGDPWLPCHHMSIDAIDGSCKLHVWPFGVAAFHLVEELALPTLAALSVWRIQSYKENLSWAASKLHELTGNGEVSAAYVLSAYWMCEPGWSGEVLERALRILSIPKVLLDRDVDPLDALGHAELVEQTLLADGFDHPDIVQFGIKGISSGYASWSGVVYHPTAEQRALAEVELTNCELAVQSLWAYCEHLNGQVERGLDPVVPTEYGWRFLRAARSRLFVPRSQESEQHRAMRNAILATCGIDNHLTHAIDSLRESNGG